MSPEGADTPPPGNTAGLAGVGDDGPLCQESGTTPEAGGWRKGGGPLPGHPREKGRTQASGSGRPGFGFKLSHLGAVPPGVNDFTSLSFASNH